MGFNRRTGPYAWTRKRRVQATRRALSGFSFPRWRRGRKGFRETRFICLLSEKPRVSFRGGDTPCDGEFRRFSPSNRLCNLFSTLLGQYYLDSQWVSVDWMFERDLRFVWFKIDLGFFFLGFLIDMVVRLRVELVRFCGGNSKPFSRISIKNWGFRVRDVNRSLCFE